jgi:hypothetical protein
VPLESIEDPILRGALVTAVVAPAGD